MDSIVDIAGLAGVLKISVRTLKKRWQEFPHFFVGVGRNLKSARFDIGDVLSHLKAKDYERLERPESRRLDRKILVSEQGPQEGRLPDPGRRPRVAGPKARRTGEPPATDPDPFHLLTGLH